MVSVLGDLNAKPKNWCENGTAFHEGFMIDAVMSNYGLHQLFYDQHIYLTHSLLVRI